ncbi:MAG: hypothetical protein QXR53_00680 [Candidatus Norongarragalinales archaeon]
MEALVLHLKAMGLEHYSEIPLKGTNHKVLKFFFPPPKYELAHRWFWPFGKGYVKEVEYEDKLHKLGAHDVVTQDAYEMIGKHFKSLANDLLVETKKRKVGLESEVQVNFVELIPLSKKGQAILDELKKFLEKHDVPHREKEFQENSAAAEFFEWGN